MVMDASTLSQSAAGAMKAVWGSLRQAWRYTLSVYWLNAMEWRLMKSGVLVFFGLLCWLAGNLFLSYRPDITVASFVIAYGFVLIVWGPLTHLVLLPVIIRIRRSGRPGLRWVSRYGSKLGIILFVVLVLVLGAYPPDVMMLEYGGPPAVGDPAPPVAGDLDCVTMEGVVSCQVVGGQGFDHVVVLTGGRELLRVDDPPYAFEVQEEDLAEGHLGRYLAVELRNAEGEILRRYVRTV